MSELDTDVLKELVRPTEAAATVYLGLRSPIGTGDVAGDLHLRWRSMRTRLAEQGADEATLAAIDATVTDVPIYPAELAVVARAGRVRLAHQMPGAKQYDRARFATPPEIVPLLLWLQRHPPYVVVVTDRTGADLTAVPRGAATGSASTVEGPDDEIERNAPGGWSQPRYQRRAEDSWLHNARAVADAAGRAVETVRAELLLVAGDVRAVQLLEEHLPPAIHKDRLLHHLPGGRSADGSDDVRQAAIAETLQQYAADQTAALLERLAENRPAGTTVEGVAATLAALEMGRVETLFVADDPSDERTAWYSPQVLCAAERPDIPEVEDGWPRQGRLVDLAVRAAVLTDAEVRVVDATEDRLTDGIAGICRYPLPVG
jgi:peptide subunit release factor 1 (eRF1)